MNVIWQKRINTIQILSLILSRYVGALTSLYEQYNPKYGDIDTELVITWYKIWMQKEEKIDQTEIQMSTIFLESISW